MPFDRALWRGRQNDWGQPIRWFRQEHCSCFNPQSQEWDRSHSVCGGMGSIFLEQDVSGYKAILANSGLSMEQDQAGRIIEQTLIAETFSDEIPLEEGDEIIPYDLDRLVNFEEVLRRGVKEKLFYPFYSATSCRRNNVLYVGEVDFAVVDQEVIWAEGAGPSSGETYSIRYLGLPRYHVFRVLRRGYPNPTRAATCRLLQPDENRVYFTLPEEDLIFLDQILVYEDQEVYYG